MGRYRTRLHVGTSCLLTKRDFACLVAVLFLSASGCVAKSELVVYTALDAQFSQQVFDEFQQETKLTVQPKYDTEATKTVGLVNAILGESKRPRCDVFWNNEILNTLRLQQAGLLAPVEVSNAEDYPEQYRSPDGLWYGFAARARVLLVNTNLLAEADRPTSIYDLGNERFRGKSGLAKPLFGTTATHAACLFAALGDESAKAFFLRIKANDAKIMAGNKQVALAVSAGELAFGLTDTDDAMIEIEQGRPVAIVFPDQGESELGTLYIPNTLAMIRGCPHPEAAAQLINYLLQSEVEDHLSAGPSAQVPLNRNSQVAARVETPRTVKAMEVDFQQAAAKWDQAATFITTEFTGP